jgi:hypothetical protein
MVTHGEITKKPTFPKWVERGANPVSRCLAEWFSGVWRPECPDGFGGRAKREAAPQAPYIVVSRKPPSGQREQPGQAPL